MYFYNNKYGLTVVAYSSWFKSLNLASASQSDIHPGDICCRTTVPVQEVSLLPIAMPVTTAIQMNSLARSGEFPTQLTRGEVNGRSGQMT